MAAAAAAAAASSSSGFVGGPVAAGVVLAFVILREIRNARRNERRAKHKATEAQIQSAAQILQNVLGMNGEALAIAQSLSTTPKKKSSYDLDYSYNDIPTVEEEIDTEAYRYSRFRSYKPPGKTNPNWAFHLAADLLDITGGNLNKINQYKLEPRAYDVLMQKVASGEVAAIARTFKTPDCFTKDDNYKWLDDYGIVLYDLAIAKGFTPYGAITILAHAYREGATTAAGRATRRKNNNWWNFGPLKSRGQKGDGRWATFPTIESGFEAYYDRITSPSDLIEYQNPNFNPSYPLFGKLLVLNRFATEEELNQGFRIKVGDRWGSTEGYHDYVYVWDEAKDLPDYDYANEIRQLIVTVKRQFDTYITSKIKCLQTELTSLKGLRDGYVKQKQSYGPITNFVDPYKAKILILELEIEKLKELKTTIDGLNNGL